MPKLRWTLQPGAGACQESKAQQINAARSAGVTGTRKQPLYIYIASFLVSFLYASLRLRLVQVRISYAVCFASHSCPFRPLSWHNGICMHWTICTCNAATMSTRSALHPSCSQSWHCVWLPCICISMRWPTTLRPPSSPSSWSSEYKQQSRELHQT